MFKSIRNSIFGWFILALLASGCTTHSEEAAAYNDKILIHQLKISGALDSLKKSFRKHEAIQMDRALVDFKKSVYDGIKVVDAMSSFGKDTLFKTEAKKLFNTYESMSNHEFPMMIEILSMPDSLFGTSDQNKLFQIQSEMNLLIKDSEDIFREAQNEFGIKHKLEFVQKTD